MLTLHDPNVCRILAVCSTYRISSGLGGKKDKDRCRLARALAHARRGDGCVDDRGSVYLHRSMLLDVGSLDTT